jgi:hypothetical protein
MLRRIAAVAAAIAAILLVVLAVGVWIGASEAAKHALPGLTVSEEERALEEARTGIWDNPIESILYFSMAVTEAKPVGDDSCEEYEVTAYTFFGRVASTMETDCEGGRRTS